MSARVAITPPPFAGAARRMRPDVEERPARPLLPGPVASSRSSASRYSARRRSPPRPSRVRPHTRRAHSPPSLQSRPMRTSRTWAAAIGPPQEAAHGPAEEARSKCHHHSAEPAGAVVAAPERARRAPPREVGYQRSSLCLRGGAARGHPGRSTPGRTRAEPWLTGQGDPLGHRRVVRVGGHRARRVRHTRAQVAEAEHLAELAQPRACGQRGGVCSWPNAALRLRAEAPAAAPWSSASAAKICVSRSRRASSDSGLMYAVAPCPPCPSSPGRTRSVRRPAWGAATARPAAAPRSA